MSTPSEYIAGADATKRDTLKKLHRLIRTTLPELAPCSVHGMIGYGPYHYRYDSGREGDSARVALAANKTGYSVYIMAVDAKGTYLAEKARAKLGRATVGKSCIRFKRLEDLALDALVDVLRAVRTATALGERRDVASTRAAKKTPAKLAKKTPAKPAKKAPAKPART